MVMMPLKLNGAETPVLIRSIVITEMDSAMKSQCFLVGSYRSCRGEGFKQTLKIMDETGNVSWLIFTDAHLLAQFKLLSTARCGIYFDRPKAAHGLLITASEYAPEN